MKVHSAFTGVIAMALIAGLSVFLAAEMTMNDVKDPNLRFSLRTYGKTNVNTLANLVLNANRIIDITPLGKLGQLTRLELYHNSITNISSLSNLGNLSKLYLGRNKIRNIAPLRFLKNLTILDIHKNEISDISPLGELTKLRELDIRDDNVDLGSFKDWKFEENLQILDRNGKYYEIATNEKELWCIVNGIVEPSRQKAVQPDTNSGTNGPSPGTMTNW